jgi:CubicO group peptidase (beta-lactamase class C family)
MRMMSNSFLRRWRHRVLAIVVVFAFVRTAAFAQSLPESQRSRIDSAVTSILAASGVPSASIAVVQNGRVVYENAYGSARIGVPATPAMRYSIGSVTKQFTATAVLLLAEEGKLTIDDKVSKWLPDLTQADNVTIRQLLSMTAGYQDYCPQDYMIPAVLSPTTPQDVLAQWARKPLDFKPGTAWQYSSTNYFAAGLIVEKASGMPLMEFLKRRIFTPLRMTSVRNVDAAPLEAGDAAGYLRNALGPLRPAPKEAKGWLFAAGGLSMTAHDLALWDIAMINRTVLKPESYREMFKEARLSNGNRIGYGLGVGLDSVDGRKRIAHDGAAAGYMAANVIYPDNRVAVVTFVNIYPGASDPEWDISGAIARIIFENKKREEKRAGSGPKADTKTLNQIRQVFLALQNGEIDRSLFTPNANAYFTTEALTDFASSLGPLGVPTEFRLTSLGYRGGMILSMYRGVCGGVALSISVIALPDGKIEQYLVARAR